MILFQKLNLWLDLYFTVRSVIVIFFKVLSNSQTRCDILTKLSDIEEKKNEEDTKKWKYVPCSWVGRINIIKMSIPPKGSYRFNARLTKISIIYFIYLEKNSKNYYETIKDSKWPQQS